MKIKHLLIDLDDTLLENNMDTFAPGYYSLLSKTLAEFCPPERLLPALMAGTKAMMLNDDADKTLETTFDEIFYPQIGVEKKDIAPHILSFYQNQFTSLKSLTKTIPAAKKLVDTALAKGYQVTVATNPLFPRVAIDQRLKWAELPASQYPFAVVTSYETFHFCKPNPKYYLEILSRLQADAAECLMIGNDLDADILPALKAGLSAFHISSSAAEKPDGYRSGTLADVTNSL